MNAVVKSKTPTTRPQPPEAISAPPAPRETRLRRLFSALFGIDVRTLALFRIGMGLLIIADLITRGVDMQALYTEAGVMPQAALSKFFSTHAIFSLHFLNGSLTAQVILFCIAGLFALALIIGYQTRWAAFVSWALMLSLQSRNPLVLTGGDNVFRVLMFWSLFLPLGACWSLDRALSKTPAQVPQRIVSMGSAGLLLQVCIIYWFTALLKWGVTWHDNTAVYYALSVDQYAKPLAYALLPHRDLLRFLTFVTWRLEM
ncbi:MAG TPA: hypothetical protein VFB21_14410, partial [Chthonomonadaceae bacterium]|nr:hypothetical protein [Chthonomonadaceae bacterium]